MQTFLPYPDFVKSAECLDYRRLGKQRVEAKQILDILLNETDKKGWRNHPAVLMWKGYEEALALYHDTIILEWKNRGYKNSMVYMRLSYDNDIHNWKALDNLNYRKYQAGMVVNCDNFNLFNAVELPPWLTDEFCSYHRATLLYKNPEWYSQFGWTENPKYEYLWPVQNK